jgi:anionic cell wall polymer biosynthesis LytR-Cps2A-Psr (LCP) family protein
MRKFNYDASWILLAAIILLTVLGILFAAYYLRTDLVIEALTENRVIYILYIIENEGKPVSTYALMFYPATKRIAIIDIPGELGLLITRTNRVDRIDSIYDPARITNYLNEIQKLLGIDINFSIVITKENLVKLVDILGGVEVFIPAPVEMDGRVMFPSGMTLLDGDKAGVYATYRIPEEDQEMTVFRRQRFFLGFLKRQSEMNEAIKKPEVAGLYYSFLRTNLSANTQARLFDELVNIDTERTNVQSVGGNLREVSGQMLLIPHWDGNLIKEIVRQTSGTLTRQADISGSDRAFTVEVLNGTAVNGLAGRTAELLRSFGFDVISIGNADRGDYEKTAIVDRSGNEIAARDFAGIIRCENIVKEDPFPGSLDVGDVFEFQPDFTLTIGMDFNGRYVTGN